jgi:hypothetical protein
VNTATAASAGGNVPLHAIGIPVDFILFALPLLGVALFHNQTLYVALAYVLGLFFMLAILDWHPDKPHRRRSWRPSSGSASARSRKHRQNGDDRDNDRGEGRGKRDDVDGHDIQKINIAGALVGRRLDQRK